ncbi:MAG: hypothetical protein R3C24_17785 [Cyanobacteriota/Melainabacteria group bacterium]
MSFIHVFLIVYCGGASIRCKDFSPIGLFEEIEKSYYGFFVFSNQFFRRQHSRFRYGSSYTIFEDGLAVGDIRVVSSMPFGGHCRSSSSAIYSWFFYSI